MKFRKEIDIEGYNALVEISVTKYRPATFNDPAEGGEIEVECLNLWLINTEIDPNLFYTFDYAEAVQDAIDEERERKKACALEYQVARYNDNIQEHFRTYYH